jgi:TonB family protein
MIKFIITFSLLALVFRAGSQTIEVKGFRWLEDTLQTTTLSAQKDPMLMKCALIKVIAFQKGFDFNFDSEVKALATEQKEGEIWLWAPVGAKKITITDKQTNMSCIYPFGNELQENGVYALFIKIDNEKKIAENKVESVWLQINTNPQDANIFIDDIAVGQTFFVGSVPSGKHKLLLELNGAKEEGTFLFTKDEKPDVWLDFIKEGMIPELKDTKRLSSGADKEPVFPGGYDKMMRFFQKNAHYPKTDNNQGTVFVSFIVGKTGKIYNVKVLPGLSSDCDKEAVRVVKMMPNWNPEKKNGKAISCIFQIPFKFTP